MAKKLKSLNPIIGTGYKTLSKIKDGEDGNIENFPDTLPKIPRLSYKRLGVSGLEIGWEFEDKIYYTYELYGSTTKGFEASEENLMFQGLASSYFYEAKPGEKWYFKARAKNTHGRYTEFSSELVTYTVKLDNLGEYVEGGSINGALIENATINNAHIKDLHADKITAGILDADRIGANSITANKIEANAITSEKIQANAITSGKIQANAITTDKLAANIIASNHIQSGTITSGHIQSGTIESDHIKSNSINSNHIQANTIQSEHIQTGAITAGSGIIAEGAIGSAQISSLDAAKIEAGTIDTSKVTIQGADGHLRLKGNRMQVFQGTGNQARERVSLGDVNGNGSVYGLRVRGADGTTILLDENGVKSEGITDGAITNDKISDDANIDGAKLNINSVVNKINEDGTETIQGTKIEVDGTTLNTKLSTITTKQTEDSERITQAQSQITANTNAIKLKVDEQTYTTDKRDMTSKLEKNTSEISAMKGQIALKVEQTDVTNAINNLKIGGKNLLLNSAMISSSNWSSFSGTIVNGYKPNVNAMRIDNSSATSGYVDKLQQEVHNGTTKLLEPSSWYTFSFYVKGSGKLKTHIYPSLIDTSIKGYTDEQECALWSDGDKDWNLTDAWTRHTYTFKTRAEIPATSQNVLFRVYYGNDVYICMPQLEKGNKTSDWNIAPEDIDNNTDKKINSAKAEIKVTTDAISQNVSNLSQTVSTKADGSTVSSLNSKVSLLETSVNGISGKVTSLEKTTTTLGTQVDTANTNASSALNKANSATTTANNAQNTANTNKSNITDLQGEVSTVKSNVASLEVTTNGISQKVSSVESTTATLSGKVDAANNNATNALNTANSTNTKLNNLQIGGRNLLRNSQNYSNWLGENGTTVNTIDNSNEPTKILQVTTNGGAVGHVKINVSNYTRGKEYILSFYAKNISGDKTIKFEPHGGPVYSVTSTSEWVQYKVKIIPNQNWSSTVPYFYFNNKNNTSVFQIKNVKLEEGNKATDWTPAPEDIDSNLNDVKNSLNSFQNTVNTTFKDGIIEEAEAKAISQHLKTLDTEKADIDKEYSTIYSNTNLTGSAKTNLASAKTSFDSAHASLKSTINTVISDGRVSSSESASVTSTFNTYNTQLGVYKQRIQEALDAIGSAKVDNLQIGGRNLIRKADVAQNNSTATFNESTKTWTIKASAGAGGAWGCGLVLINRNILVPYGKSYVLSFEIKVPRNCSWNIDVNNFALTGSSWAGNDNDNIPKRSTSSNSLIANQWIKCWAKWENTNANNSNKVDLYDISNFGVVMQNETSDMTYEIRNIQGELGNMPTEYTPAPEDVDGAINSVDSKVDTLRTEYNSTKSKVATLETDLSGITSRVSSAETNIEKISNASSQNLLYNSDFRIVNGGIPDGWSVSDNSKITLDTSSTLLDGIPTFWFNVTGLTENAWKAVYSPFIDAKAGEKFVASAYVKGHNNWSVLDAGGGLEIEYFNDSTRLATSGASINKSNLNWQRLVAKGTAPTGTTRVRIRVYPSKNGQFNMSKPMLQYGETVTGWDRGFDIKNLTTRLKTAEQKITDDAITNTVSKKFYTKTDIDNKGYQTETQVQQTVNGLEVKVSQSGGYNLLRNSGFKKDSLHWGTQNHNSPTGGTISYLEHTAQWGFPDVNVKCCQIRLSGQTSKEYGIAQTFNTTKGKKYTISFYYAGHRVPKANMIIRGTTSNSVSWLTNKDFVPTSKNGGNASIDNWALFTHTFTATLNSHTLNIVINDANNDGYMWIAQPMIEEGELHNPYSPHPSEVYDGITQIDKDGIKINQSNINGYTHMSASGFYVNKSGEDVVKVTNDGVYIKGRVDIVSGSVPTSSLSGTINSNQLNSTITNDISTAKNNASSAITKADNAQSTADSATTKANNAQSTANSAVSKADSAQSTANTANNTLNSNKDNWSNAYNRVREWANGAITGSTSINGGMIATNTITTNKLAVGDFTNISQIDENLAPNGNTVITHSDNYKYFRFGNDSSAGYHPLQFAILNGGTFKVGDRFKFTFIGFGNKSISTTFVIRARYTDNTWNNLGSASYTFDTANKTRTVELQITSGLTAGKTLQRVTIFNEFNNTTGLAYMRNICINRMATGELIVDGAITADKIASRVINADKIVSGTITSNEIKAGTITATQMAANSVTADKIAAGAITANKIASGAITATMITSGTLDASKVNVTNLNASNIKSGKLSANYIDATNLSVKGELLSGQINGIGGMKFADGAIISSYDSHVPGYKGIQISAPSIKLGDKVDIYSPTLISTVTGKSSTSSTSSSWTMSSSGGLNCSTINTSSTTTIGGSLNVRNNMINGMNNLQMGRGSVYIPIFGSSSNFDYIKGGRGTIAFADTGPIHFLYNGTKSSFIAGGSVYLPHAGTVNCDHFRLGAGIIASPSSGSFHFLTANGATSPLYAGILYSATRMSLDEPMVVSSNSVFDKINSIDVIETKDGLRLYNPIQTTKAIDKSTEVVKTEYDEDKNEINTSIDYTSAIATLWKAVQELKQENNELKEIIKDIHSKL